MKTFHRAAGCKAATFVVLFVTVAAFGPHGNATAAEEFRINASNFTMDGIHELLKKEHRTNPDITVDCIGSWKIMWPEIKRGNAWAALAYAVDFRAPIQNQRKFRDISRLTRAIYNTRNILANALYLNFENKTLLRDLENSFDERPGYPSRLHRIAEQSGFNSKELFVEFATCIKSAKDQPAADACFHEVSAPENILDFDAFVNYIDDASIRTKNDVACV
ncbi:hypothetical protein ACQKGL_13445 [Ensifer adhaerens]|uniref:hypothetical protein n=1 Tax=Ensifer adhaerens TaxID=106592 RepID=UPI003CFBEDA4